MGKLPTQLLFLGVVLAATVMAAGTLVAKHEQRQTLRDSAVLSDLDRRQERCIPEWLQAHPDNGPGISAATLSAATAACADPNRAAIDKQMHAASSFADQAEQWTPRIAGGVSVVLAAPWIWHFLLRLIAALHGAIVRKPPAR